MKQFFLCVCVLLGARGLLADQVSTTGNISSPYQRHMDFVSDLGADAVDTLTDKEINEIEREIRFSKIFTEAFAVKQIAQFALGRHARRADAEEKEEFLRLFKKNISKTYAQRFKNYNNQLFEVVGARPVGNNGVKVLSQIIRAGAPPVDVEWKIYEMKDGSLKIFDVVVENISMSMTQRSEYGSIIQKNGGKVKDLNRVLGQSMRRFKEVSFTP